MTNECTRPSECPFCGKHGLTVPKWVLINQPQIPQMLQKCSAQIVSQEPPHPPNWYLSLEFLNISKETKKLSEFVVAIFPQMPFQIRFFKNQKIS